jgi:hypothetical protein
MKISPLGQYSKSQKRKAPVSVESRMGGKKKKCGIVDPFAADQMLHPYIIQTASNSVALTAFGVHTNSQRCSNQSTN